MHELSQDTRNWSMFAHFSATIAQLFLPSFAFMGPLVILLIRNEDSVVQYHAKQALFFQIGVSIAIWAITAIATALSCIVIGIFIYPLAIIPWLAGMFLPLYAGLQINNGEDYRYPLVGDMVDRPIELP